MNGPPAPLHHLPDDWTPAQALAVYELLNTMAEAIWRRYEPELLALIAPAADEHTTAPEPFEPFEFDDDLPF